MKSSGRKTFYLLGAISVALLLVAAACARAAEPTATPRPAAGVAPTATPRPAPATPTPVPAKVGLTEWVVGLGEDPTVKPTALTAGGGVGPGRAHAQIYETLLHREGLDFRTVPAAAQSWETPDKTTAIFQIRKGIKSHKGTDLTAADWVYSWGTSKENAAELGTTNTWRSVKSIEAPDPYTLKVTFSSVDVTFWTSTVTGRVHPKERGPYKSAQAEAWDKAPWGHGPYKVLRYERDKPIDLEAFEGYYKGVAKPTKMKIMWMRDASTRVAALLAGEAHLVEALPLAQASVIKARKDLAIAAVKGARPVYWQFNMRDEPFSNLKVRQALNYAMNKDVVVNDVLGGYGAVAAAPFTRGFLGYEESKDLKPYPYDPAKAVQLLREAGYDRGFAFDFMASSGVFQKDQEIAEAYASMWEAIGLKPRLRITERGTIFDVFREGDKWDISGTFQWGTGLEVDGYLSWLVGPYSKLLTASPSLQPLRDLKEQGRQIVELTERGKLYGQLNRTMKDIALLPFSHVQDDLFGLSRETGWVPFPLTGSFSGLAYYNYAELMGYGPNYEKWAQSGAQSYWQ